MKSVVVSGVSPTQQGTAAVMEVAKALIARGTPAINASDEDGLTILIIAAREGDHEAVKLLIDHGADVNAEQEEGRTALMMAAINGHLNVTKTLLSGGATIDAVDVEGSTALILASRCGNDEVVEALIEHGAQVNVTDDVMGWTALASKS